MNSKKQQREPLDQKYLLQNEINSVHHLKALKQIESAKFNLLDFLKKKGSEKTFSQESMIENEEKPDIKYCSQALPNPNFLVKEGKQNDQKKNTLDSHKKSDLNFFNTLNLKINLENFQMEKNLNDNHFLKQESTRYKKEVNRAIIRKSRNKSIDSGYTSGSNSLFSKMNKKSSGKVNFNKSFDVISKAKKNSLKKYGMDVGEVILEQNENYSKFLNENSQNVRNIKGNNQTIDYTHYNVLLEGYIGAIKIGRAKNYSYIQRYCKISKSYFKYYKDQYNAENFLSRPICSIAISEIESVKAINFQDKTIQKKHSLKNDQFCFEIKTYSKDTSKDKEIANVRFEYYKDCDQLKEKNLNSNLKEISMLDYTQDNKSLFKLQRKFQRKSIQENCISNRTVCPLENNNNVYNKCKGIKENFYCKDKGQKQFVFEKVCLNQFDEMQEFYDYYMKNRSRLCNPYKKINLEQAKGLQHQKITSEKKIFLHKEMDCSVASNAFLFAVKTKEELSIYLSILNWLIEKHNYIKSNYKL